MTDHTALFVGFGYCARFAAPELAAAGLAVAGTTRDPARAAMLLRAGVRGIIWDGHGKLPEEATVSGNVLIVSAPPGADGCPVLTALPEGKLPERVLYYSSAGVYGDHGGAWIDEDAPCRPGTARGAARLSAEAAWTAWSNETGVPLAIFRLAGIYGPGRNVLERMKAADGVFEQAVTDGQIFNRIHVADIARATLAFAVGEAIGSVVYNLADDCPAPPEAPVLYAAEKAGLPPPRLVPLDDAALSPMARSFYGENKRLRNDRLKEMLGSGLLYPDYRAGIDSLLTMNSA